MPQDNPPLLDKTMNTTEQTPRNLADVLASGLANIANNVKPDGSDISISVPGMSANNVDDGFSELKQSLTLKTYGSVNYQATSINYEYTGLTFTIPTGKTAIVNVNSLYVSGKPTGIIIAISSTNYNSNVTALENATIGVQGLMAMLTSGTYYIWDRRASIPSATNPITVKGLEF